jgi:hypothetical protein
VNVGISKDTAQFAVSAIRSWWLEMGIKMYPGAKKILIHADGGGSNGSRNRLWKRELQLFCTDYNLEVTVSHFPPGTSKSELSTAVQLNTTFLLPEMKK